MKSTYRKRAIPEATRRGVALRYGCEPGQTLDGVPCHWCSTPGEINWTRLASGKPAAWVTFTHELDHLVPEVLGGSSEPENIVLACRSCNRSRGHRLTTSSRHPHCISSEPLTTSSRHPHWGNREQGTGKGKEQGKGRSIQDQVDNLTVGAPLLALVWSER